MRLKRISPLPNQVVINLLLENSLDTRHVLVRHDRGGRHTAL